MYNSRRKDRELTPSNAREGKLVFQLLKRREKGLIVFRSETFSNTDDE